MFASSTSSGQNKSRNKLRWLLYGSLLAILLLILSRTKTTELHICLPGSRSKSCSPPIQITIPKSVRSLPYRMEDQGSIRNIKQAALNGTGDSRTSMNSTLGFQKVFVLNLTSKRARKSEMQLLLRHYDISYTLIEGVDGKSDRLSPKDEKEKFKYGRKEGHAKIWQKMLQERIESAIIFEDEVDMDRRIHYQLELLQEPLARFLNIVHSGNNSTSISAQDPWNTALWDMLWFGQCEESAWTEAKESKNQNSFLTYLDPTRAKVTQYGNLYKAYKLPFHGHNLHKHLRLRIIQAVRSPRCLSAYGMSRSGAARALYQNAHKEKVRDIDEDLVALAQENRLRAYSINPGLFVHRVAQDGNKEDGELVGDTGSFRPLPGSQGLSRAIDNSARENLLSDIMKDDKVIVRQQGKY